MLYIQFNHDPEPQVYPSGYPVETWLYDIQDRTGKKIVRADNRDGCCYNIYFPIQESFLHVDGHLSIEDLAIKLVDKHITDPVFVKKVFGKTIADLFIAWSATNPNTERM